MKQLFYLSMFFLLSYNMQAQIPNGWEDIRIRHIVEVLPYWESETCGILEGQKRNKCRTEALSGFVQSRLVYPAEAIKNKIEGTVVIKFVVEKDGSLSNFVFDKNIGSGCGTAALTALQEIDQLVPARLNGKVVRSYFWLPVEFSLDKK